MSDGAFDRWRHDHTFGQDVRRAGELRTMLVIGLTATMMVVEIAAGMLFGSLALLADGLHMASHAAALTVTAVAYVYARRRAGDPSFSFGTGKVNALGGFTSAVLLVVFAALMVWESVDRFLRPVAILFDQAIFVAVAGLVVNGVSALILGGGELAEPHDSSGSSRPGGHHDHNLRAAYLHVLADAMTSLLAIFALLTGKYLGLVWLDPTMGLVGAFLVVRWSRILLRDTGRILLDRQAPAEVQEAIREAVKTAGGRVVDLHVWTIGPGVRAASLTVVADDPKPPEHYKARIPADLRLGHVTVEVHGRGAEEPVS